MIFPPNVRRFPRWKTFQIVHLRVTNAKTFFHSDSDDSLEVMFRKLRVKNKNSYWAGRAAIKRAGYIWRMDPEDREAERERLWEQAKYTRFYSRRDDSFATGLLDRVLPYLVRKGIGYTLRDERTPIRTKGSLFEGVHFEDDFEEREEQTTAIRAALSLGRGILACATNAGKTDLAAVIVSEYHRQLKLTPTVLFLVHRTGIVSQSLKRFKGHLDNKIFRMAMIGGGKKEIPPDGILFATTQTASNLVQAKDPDFLKFLQRCDILFCDELHINKAVQATRVAEKCNAGMRFGLSGTIKEESKTKFLHYQGMTGPVIARISNKELVEKGRSSRPHIRLVEYKAPELKDLSFGDAYRLGIVKCRERNRAVMREALRYVDKDRHVMITVARIKHGLRLKQKLEHRTDVPVEFISGSTPSDVRDKVLARFAKGKIPLLIASPIMDVGMDLAAGAGAWVNAAGAKSWELLLQRMGRVLRRNKFGNRVLISDFIDKQNKYLMKHSLARLKHYKAEDIATFEFVKG